MQPHVAQLTRQYLRTIDPASIRQLPLLQQALEQLEHRYNADGNYSVACEQLETIRQDLVAGRVEDIAFARCVYETHALLALAAGDLAELRTCIAMLRQLYTLPGEGGTYAAQGLLFALLAHVCGTHKDVLMLELRDVAQRRLLDDAHVARALRLCRATLAGDYVQFACCLKEYDDGNVLVRSLCERVVQRTCCVVLAAFLPTVPVERVRSMLPMRGPNTPLPCMFVVTGDVVDVRASRLESKG